MTTGRLRKRDATRLPVIGGVPRANPHFTGREDILEQIHEVFSRPGSRFLIGGGSGVGKSRIATEYAHRYAEEYDLIWWIPASTDIDSHRAYLRLAEHIGLPVAYEHVPRAVQTVRDALSGGHVVGRWLLVFDDVTDVERLATDYFPDGGDGDILVTSRDHRRITRSLPAGRFDGQVVPRLTNAESLSLLRQVCPERVENPRNGERLAELLEYLPLALDQVGAFLRESTVPTVEFLDTFEELHNRMLCYSGPDDHTIPLKVAWSIQSEELASGGEEHETEHMVLELIRLCAFLAPRPLGRALFSRSHDLGPAPSGTVPLGDDVLLGRVLDFMSRHHLAYLDHERDTLQLHELFQSVIRESLPHTERVRYRDLAHLVLARSDPGNPTDSAYRTTYLRLYAHVKASQAWLSRDPRVRGLVLNVVDLLTEVGDYSNATGLVEQAVNSWSDDPFLRMHARLRRNKIRRVHGEYVTALAEAERIHAEQIEREDGDNDESLESLRAVAISFSGLGRFEEAGRHFRHILDHRRSKYTESDPQTLEAAHDYGQVLQEQGRFEAALAIDQHTFQGRRFVLGPNDVHTLRSGLSVGLNLILLGRLEEARAQIEECMERFTSAARPDSPHAIQGRMLLSVIYRRLGSADASLREARRSMSLYDRKYPPTGRLLLYLRAIHMVTLAGTGSMSDLEEAVRDAELLLRPLDERYPNEHPFPATARLSAAIVLRASGRYTEALELDRQGLERVLRIYGAGAFSCLPASLNVATDLFHLDRVEEARRLDSMTEADCRNRLPADHPILLTARRNHLVSRHAAGERVGPEWEGLREEFFSRFGPDHPGTASMSTFTRQDCDVFPIAPL